MSTFRTLFSGGELFGIGARQAGYTHLDGYEIDPSIAAVARLNGFDVRVADVCDIDYDSLPPADHLHASPSCKTASQANTKAGETDGDRAVAGAICRAIAAHQGRSFTLENVPGYRWFESFDRICATLKATGFIFRVVPKGGEKPAWRESTPLWNDAGEFIDAADFGVPQNRKRLYLRAVRGLDRVPGLRPTHGRRGGILLAHWIGWYAAIADLIDTLPETTPAPWQRARLPAELRETLLVGPSGFDGTVVAAGEAEPSFTVTAAGNHSQWRAFLLGDQSAGHGAGVQVAEADAPAFTVRSSDHNGFPRAYLCGGGNTQLAQADSHARAADEPAFTLRDGRNGSPERAYLLDGDNARADDRCASVRAGVEPAITVRGGRNSAHRAYVGRWVRLTVQALGRLQTVPDSYIGLTAEINGNGVACLLAQRIMESLRCT